MWSKRLMTGKVWLFGTNLITCLVGIALLITSIFYDKVSTSSTVKEYVLIFGEVENLISYVPILMIVMGIVLFIISFMGCWGPINESIFLIATYSIILFVIICLEAGCIAFVNINQEKYITGSDDEKYEKERKLTDMCLAMYILLGIEGVSLITSWSIIYCIKKKKESDRSFH